MNKIRKLFQFSWHQYKVLGMSWLLYIKWDILISFVHYNYWQSNITVANNAEPHNAEPNNETLNNEKLNNKALNKHSKLTDKSLTYNQVVSLIKLNEMAGRNHFRYMNCLRRCLCQKNLLNQYKVQCNLHLGVKFVEGKLAAHSWLSYNGAIINDSEALIATYKELTPNEHIKNKALFSLR